MTMERRDFLKVLGGVGAVLALPAQQVMAVTKELVLAGPAEMTQEIQVHRNERYRTTMLRMGITPNGATSWIASNPDAMLLGVTEVMVVDHRGYGVEIMLNQLRLR